MQLKKTCGNCRFYIEITPKYKSGECRFNPPVVISDPNPPAVKDFLEYTAAGFITTAWPVVSAAEKACGKWVQK